LHLSAVKESCNWKHKVCHLFDVNVFCIPRKCQKKVVSKYYCFMPEMFMWWHRKATIVVFIWFVFEVAIFPIIISLFVFEVRLFSCCWVFFPWKWHVMTLYIFFCFDTEKAPLVLSFVLSCIEKGICMAIANIYYNYITNREHNFLITFAITAISCWLFFRIFVWSILLLATLVHVICFHSKH